ncbi:BON1-associated protein 2-like [Magnolia sinica]|uniref:BON1-associated protein 2-like n=1 Tax=Magnolia sinica TaxID=86752 RepID=UPI00265864D5|nr:BON1-associated protein 2-like [Magnolia sinica]
MERSNHLEITVISAEALRIHNHPIKNTYVNVGIDSHNCLSTALDRDGGSYPSWNEKLRLALPPSARSITVVVHCKTASGLKTVGTANIPTSDILKDYVPAHLIHFLSYRLREWDGRPNGIINLSARMVGPDYVGRSMMVKPSAPVQGLSNAGEKYAGVAVGIPVSHGCRV